MARVKEPIVAKKVSRASKGQWVGYIRVSTLDQWEDRQLEGLELDRRFVDHVPGKDVKRPQLTALLSFVRSFENATLLSATLWIGWAETWIRRYRAGTPRTEHPDARQSEITPHVQTLSRSPGPGEPSSIPVLLPGEPSSRPGFPPSRYFRTPKEHSEPVRPHAAGRTVRSAGDARPWVLR